MKTIDTCDAVRLAHAYADVLSVSRRDAFRLPPGKSAAEIVKEFEKLQRRLGVVLFNEAGIADARASAEAIDADRRAIFRMIFGPKPSSPECAA
jgi:hypothetical protein